MTAKDLQALEALEEIDVGHASVLAAVTGQNKDVAQTARSARTERAAGPAAAL
jgi:hypothetical protein